jgi:hypothetical protein
MQNLILLLKMTSEKCLYFPQNFQSSLCYISKQFSSSTGEISIS